MRYCYDCEKYVETVCTKGDCGGEPIIAKDEKGYGLTRKTLIDRMSLYDVYCLKKGMDVGDYDWCAKIMESGHKGYDDKTDSDLVTEWDDVQDGFFNMIEDGNAPYELEDDPMDYDPFKEEMLLEE